jgi:hypothetical protein
MYTLYVTNLECTFDKMLALLRKFRFLCCVCEGRYCCCSLIALQIIHLKCVNAFTVSVVVLCILHQILGELIFKLL